MKTVFLKSGYLTVSCIVLLDKLKPCIFKIWHLKHYLDVENNMNFVIVSKILGRRKRVLEVS